MGDETSGIIRVTKMDAMRRQLRVAIRLWFADGDPVAIHTLVAAAHEILHTIFRRQGLRRLIFDAPPNPTKEMQRKWVNTVKAAANFFKHADRDAADATLNFHTYTNEFFILVSISGLKKMGEITTLEEEAFLHWFVLNRSEMLNDKQSADFLKANSLYDLRGVQKPDFLRQFSLFWEAVGADR